MFINISACFLDKKLEDSVKNIVRMSCWKRTKHNFSMISQAFKTRALSWTFVFILIQGALFPRYDDYMYFYLTDKSQVGFSKFTYGMLRLASFVGIFVGAFVYNFFLKHLSIRTHMVIASFINLVSAIG